MDNILALKSHYCSLSVTTHCSLISLFSGIDTLHHFHDIHLSLHLNFPNMKKYIVLLFLVAIGTSCQPPAATVDMAAETSKLQQAVDDYDATVASSDFDKVKTFYAPDAVIMPPNEPTVKGTEAVNTWVDGFKSVKGFKATFLAADVLVYPSGTSGHSLVVADLTMDGPDGKPVVENGMRDYHIWMKQPDGSWKIAVDIWNSSTAPGGE